MKQIRYIFALSTLLFGVAVLLFFALAYPHHLHYQEQYQLFLFNWDYVCDVLATGGVADLIGRFLTQFFLYAWVGASIIAVLMVAIQVMTYRLIDNWTIDNLQLNDSSRKKTNSRQLSMKKWSIKSSVAFVLSFIPSILCVCFLTDENALMTLPVVLLMGLAVLLFVLKYRNVWVILLSIPVFYLIYSPHYYRTEGGAALWAWASVWSVPVLMALCFLSTKNTENAKKDSVTSVPLVDRPIMFIILWLLLMIAGGVAVNKLQSQQKEEIMAYDFMARNGQWNRIIQRAQKKAPRNQVSVVALNLALSQRGMLTEQMFRFPQNGMAGLLPGKGKDSFSSLVTAEAFYRLGLINTAQRFVFESQEAIPDFQKSARCYKRLAETNLVNGSYEVARKYLNALRQTLFYRSWAIETLELLSDEAVDNHPVYGELRKLRCNEDYFFGGNSPQQILIKQLEANPDNRMAEEYLKAAIALQKRN